MGSEPEIWPLIRLMESEKALDCLMPIPRHPERRFNKYCMAICSDFKNIPEGCLDYCAKCRSYDSVIEEISGISEESYINISGKEYILPVNEITEAKPQYVFLGIGSLRQGRRIAVAARLYLDCIIEEKELFSMFGITPRQVFEPCSFTTMVGSLILRYHGADVKDEGQFAWTPPEDVPKSFVGFESINFLHIRRLGRLLAMICKFGGHVMPCRTVSTESVKLAKTRTYKELKTLIWYIYKYDLWRGLLAVTNGSFMDCASLACHCVSLNTQTMNDMHTRYFNYAVTEDPPTGNYPTDEDPAVTNDVVQNAQIWRNVFHDRFVNPLSYQRRLHLNPSSVFVEQFAICTPINDFGKQPFLAGSVIRQLQHNNYDPVGKKYFINKKKNFDPPKDIFDTMMMEDPMSKTRSKEIDALLSKFHPPNYNYDLDLGSYTRKEKSPRGPRKRGPKGPSPEDERKISKRESVSLDEAPLPNISAVDRNTCPMQCICGFPEPELPFVFCVGCQVWFHSRCVHVDPFTDAPYFCNECANRRYYITPPQAQDIMSVVLNIEHKLSFTKECYPLENIESLMVMWEAPASLNPETGKRIARRIQRWAVVKNGLSERIIIAYELRPGQYVMGVNGKIVLNACSEPPHTTRFRNLRINDTCPEFWLDLKARNGTMETGLFPSCVPNTEFQFSWYEGNLYCYLVASKVIEADEEITFPFCGEERNVAYCARVDHTPDCPGLKDKPPPIRKPSIKKEKKDKPPPMPRKKKGGRGGGRKNVKKKKATDDDEDDEEEMDVASTAIHEDDIVDENKDK